MEDKNAIQRRIKKDPVATLHEGLRVLNDPKLPLSYEERMSYALPLLQIKHLVLGLKHEPEKHDGKKLPTFGANDADVDQSGGGAG